MVKATEEDLLLTKLLDCKNLDDMGPILNEASRNNNLRDALWPRLLQAAVEATNESEAQRLKSALTVMFIPFSNRIAYASYGKMLRNASDGHVNIDEHDFIVAAEDAIGEAINNACNKLEEGVSQNLPGLIFTIAQRRCVDVQRKIIGRR